MAENSGSSSPFVPKGAFVFILALLFATAVAWLGFYIMLLDRGL